jgi:hypothetical protein
MRHTLGRRRGEGDGGGATVQLRDPLVLRRGPNDQTIELDWIEAGALRRHGQQRSPQVALSIDAS